ncbi:acetyltransferase [Thalassobacillus sp. CUG 92003]|uniref:acetyltransferase n=1 Tax=Thalassobacillus sp. CUG 92003 TaxID=2736641 RepID=UPI0015E6CA84|nr:acetyltransferase [Thalassobacillus sp. CUG 92003]
MIGIIGAGGHAKVITDIFQLTCPHHRLVYFTSSPAQLEGTPTTFSDSLDSLQSEASTITGWHIAIGSPSIRKHKADQLTAQHLSLITAIHPKSVIAKSSVIGAGSSIMAGAVVNPSSTIGENCIINTSSSIDHDCSIASYVNIGPGSHVAGNVQIESLSDLGAGTIVIPNIRIGKGCVIGAGSVVITDIPDDCTAVGVPAKVIVRE